jgi:hypothetical protein
LDTEWLLALGVLIRTGIVAITLVALWIGSHHLSPKVKRAMTAALVLLAICSLFIWVGLSKIRYPERYVYWNNMFHYYLGSKYFHEVGYFNLYGAALVADAENPNPFYGDVKVTRDLHTYQLIPTQLLKGNPLLTEEFVPERWDAFRADLAFIQQGIPPNQIAVAIRDHGNNAPPAQAVASGILASLLGPADWESIYLLSLLDPVLMAVLLFVIYRTFNLRTAAVVAIFFGMNELADSIYLLGAFLRLDWLVAAGLGICCLRSRRYLLAGCLLGAAAMFRVFPVMFALPVVLRGGIEFFRSGTWPVVHRRFVMGLVLSVGSLFLLSLGTESGMQVWFEFIEKVKSHHIVTATNIIGLRQVFDSGSPLLWIFRGAIALLFISSLSRVNDTQAAILGGTLIFGMLTIADYYYVFLLVFMLWDSWETVDMRMLTLLGLFFISASIGSVLLRALDAPLIQHFQLATLCLLLTFFVLFFQIHFPRKLKA